jgi:hypothetical protein
MEVEANSDGGGETLIQEPQHINEACGDRCCYERLVLQITYSSTQSRRQHARESTLCPIIHTKAVCQSWRLSGQGREEVSWNRELNFEPCQQNGLQLMHSGHAGQRRQHQLVAQVLRVICDGEAHRSEGGQINCQHALQ